MKLTDLERVTILAALRFFDASQEADGFSPAASWEFVDESMGACTHQERSDLIARIEAGE